ncbi:hypothetical protein QBC46DRAFT_413849 [Diplogelasinospora grovesii]|uniref:DUF7779 domain-containing protein n=1 Tax=Diplogelasinospora grovesii TaxID=303347 RepID=A0AAN6MWB3_9PEZI|nr:hypothetical protein QBC46DRAFT_413849 [Diplogelasinospora grovesii]
MGLLVPISFDSIRSKRPSAADVLSLMSFFDRQGIPEWLLKPLKDCRAGDERRSVSDEFGDMKSDSSAGEAEDVFDDDVSMLRDYCLVTSNEDGDEFEMHGLVQLSTRQWLEAFGRQEEFKQQFITRLAGSFPTGDYSNWATCRQLFAHVEKAADYRPADKAEEGWATLLYNGGWYAWVQGSWQSKEESLEKIGKRGCGHFVEHVVACIGASRERPLERGRGMFVQVMETRTTKLGADHPSTLTSMANLAFTWRDQGRYADSLALMRSCAQVRQRVLGPRHPDTMSTLAALDAWSS